MFDENSFTYDQWSFPPRPPTRSSTRCLARCTPRLSGSHRIDKRTPGGIVLELLAVPAHGGHNGVTGAEVSPKDNHSRLYRK